jgi:hypothetical protein
LLPGTTSTNATIELENLLKDFNVFKGDKPEVLKGELVSTHSIDASSTVLVDEHRTGMFSALRSYHSKHAASAVDDFYYAINPVAVYARKAFKDGKLTLVPLVPLSSIALTTTVGQSSIDTGNTAKIDKVKMSIVINRPMVATSQSPSAKCSVHPFFCVGDTSDRKLSNVEIRFVEHSGVKIPVLRNTQAIAACEKLLRFVPKKHVPLSIVVDAEASAPKRRRKP